MRRNPAFQNDTHHVSAVFLMQVHMFSHVYLGDRLPQQPEMSPALLLKHWQWKLLWISTMKWPRNLGPVD
jgi:hypothetical protein